VNSLKVADLLLTLLSPGHQAYQGINVSVDSTRKLGVPTLHFVANKVLTSLDWTILKTRIEQALRRQRPVMHALARSPVVSHASRVGPCCCHFAILIHPKPMLLLLPSILFSSAGNITCDTGSA
jgi:hypothetical protein